MSVRCVNVIGSQTRERGSFWAFSNPAGLSCALARRWAILAGSGSLPVVHVEDRMLSAVLRGRRVRYQRMPCEEWYESYLFPFGFVLAISITGSLTIFSRIAGFIEWLGSWSMTALS